MKDTTAIIANAAADASAAAKAAAASAAEAARIAQVASKAAADSATAIAVVATDTSWMKKSLAGIEKTLDEINKAFVTAAQHAEVLKRLDEHDKKIDRLKSSNTKNMVLLGIGTSLVTLLTSLVIWHLVGK